MKTIVQFEITETRPEKMRVAFDEGHNLVQSFSENIGEWITQKAWKDESDAIEDCAGWY